MLEPCFLFTDPPPVFGILGVGTFNNGKLAVFHGATPGAQCKERPSASVAFAGCPPVTCLASAQASSRVRALLLGFGPEPGKETVEAVAVAQLHSAIVQGARDTVEQMLRPKRHVSHAATGADDPYDHEELARLRLLLTTPDSSGARALSLAMRHVGVDLQLVGVVVD